MVNERVNTYNLRNFQEFVMSRKITICYGQETLPNILNTVPFCLNLSKEIVLQASLKERLDNGFPVTILHGYVKCILETLDFYNVKA